MTNNNEQEISARLENSFKQFNITFEEAINIEPRKLKQIGFGNRSIIELQSLKEITLEEPKQETLDKLAENYLLSSVERNQYGDELSFIDGYKLAQKTFSLTNVDILELMRRAYNAGYNQYNIVEAGLEGKDTETNVRWILTKYETEKLENSKRKRNFYCGDKVDYDEQCLEQCDRCVDCTGVDYGYYDENQ
jgi:hypothetical protein